MSVPADSQIVSCPNCGAKNRVVSAKQPASKPICGRCKTPLTNDVHPVIVTDRNYAEQVERSPFPVLLDFWAEWCGPCRIVAPVIEQLAKDFAGKVRIAKLNVDENPATAARFRVQSIPTLIVLKSGKEADRIVGAQSKEAISRRLMSYI